MKTTSFKDEFSSMKVTSGKATGCPKLTLFLWILAGIVITGCAGAIGVAMYSTLTATPPPPPTAASTQQLHDYQLRVRHEEARQGKIETELKHDIDSTEKRIAKVNSDIKKGDVKTLAVDKKRLEAEIAVLKGDKKDLIKVASEISKDKKIEQKLIDEAKANSNPEKKKKLRRRLRVAAA
tara:strand:- start:15 stop:554 length:540 start_codon:yes stop_codon:yes gene_type:complete